MSQAFSDAQVRLDANRILSRMTIDDRNAIGGHMQLIEVAREQLLDDIISIPKFVYFPVDCTLSLQYLLENGRSGEVAVIGNEGVSGILNLCDASKSPYRMVVRFEGTTWRCPRLVIRERFEASSTFRTLLMNYWRSLLVQFTQAAACNRHHTLRQQLCRWLLISMDRSAQDNFSVTQDFIAQMLGVRREGVTNAAIDLERDGLIERHRGYVRVLDRPGLEAACCECYEVIRREFGN
jgi:CRP-like cAMP-binding protein